ncbi:MAG TPA: GNAT family N-acetyltransferase [Steroidobacteraceae bacterium]
MRRLANKISLAMEERKRLRRRSTMSIAIADRFSQLSAEAWRAATDGGSVFHSAAYQRMFERVRPPNVEPRYALISDGDAPVAAVCLQIVTLDHSNLGDLRRSRLLRRLGAKMRTRVLVCGNLLVYGLHGVSIAAGADRAKVWQAVSEVIYRVRRAEKLAGSTDIVLLKDFDDAARKDSAILNKLSYGAVETEPNMVLTVNPAWRHHDDYLQSLSSKYRSDIKNRVFKKFQESGASIERLDDVEAHAAELQQLYLQVHGNAGLRPFTVPASYWPELATLSGAEARVHVARRADRIVGFIMSVRDGETALAYHIGFDRQTAGEGVPVYLRLLHASLAQAIDYGARRVSFGRTALEPKARIGCKPETTIVWARHRHPFLNQLLQPMLNLVEHDDAPEFTPFK